MEAGAHSMSPGASRDKKSRGSEANNGEGDDDTLPPALARLATTPEEVEWVRAQQRIARAQSERRRTAAPQMRGTNNNENRYSSDDSCVEDIDSSDGTADSDDDLGPSQPNTCKKDS